MTVAIYNQNAENMLYATILIQQQQKDKSKTQFLHCRFFQIALTPQPDDIKPLLDNHHFPENIGLYFCDDGDIVVSWIGDYESVCEKIVATISKKYAAQIEEYMDISDFFLDYNWLDELEKLKNECLTKLKKQTKKGKHLSSYFSNQQLIRTLSNSIQLTQMQRAFRSKPHILIVEDQVFSQKILLSILQDFTCYVAENSEHALMQYMEKRPDIVLLDIELPDIDGHRFANFVNKIDPSSYIVMVTGNRYEEDVEKAKNNNVKGFIVKPYEKETILTAVDKYIATKKRR